MPRKQSRPLRRPAVSLPSLPTLLPTTNDLNEAIRLGLLTDAKRYLNDGVIPNNTSVTLAIENGFPRLFLQRLYTYPEIHPHPSHLMQAIRYGHRDLVLFLIRRIPPEDSHLRMAISMNYKPIVSVLLQRVIPTTKSLDVAIAVENKRLIRTLFQMGVQPTYAQLELADQVGNPAITQLLADRLGETVV